MPPRLSNAGTYITRSPAGFPVSLRRSSVIGTGSTTHAGALRTPGCATASTETASTSLITQNFLLSADYFPGAESTPFPLFADQDCVIAGLAIPG